MKYSQLFGKTKKQAPKEATAVNHQLLLQAGFVEQLTAGVFTWLPLGLRVLRKIDVIIREGMDSIGGQEVYMPTLIPKRNWQTTGRWEGVDILYKTKSQTGTDYGLGFSHEEVITPLAGQYIQSYKDLPLFLYQIQTKFRDELRPKSGLLRGREFGMKDLYSFHTSQEDLHKFYEIVKQAYLKIFTRCGLTDIKITEASGGSFTKKYSHEFNVLTEAGEIELIYCSKCAFAQNVEITQKKVGNDCPKCHQSKLNQSKAIEVGNIFDLGTKFADDFQISFTDKDGQLKPIYMGCYGIGDTRLVGSIVELSHDQKGIIWPKTVAPFNAHLISLPGVEKQAESVYHQLIQAGKEVLWDDRNESAGIKFTDADLIGIPVRLVVSEKTGDKVEMKKRHENKTNLMTLTELINLLAK